ncbi:MAG: glycoside hydrolase family 172 protein [Fimbriimonadaceae bacterium]
MDFGLAQLPFLRDVTTKRASSYDKSGGNYDYWTLKPGETATLMECADPGVIRHIWMTFWNHEVVWPRKVVLRAFWDGELEPSIEAPIGDFFGIGFGILKNYCSAPLQMSPEDGKSLNSWWSMPFESARVEIVNEGKSPCNIYFYIDYEVVHDHKDLPTTRFHAQFRRENPTDGWLTEPYSPETMDEIMIRRPNLSGEGNYVALEAEGNGWYVGCNLSIDVFQKNPIDWYGEGDDMIFVDGEAWPPAIHGTGTEDYFGLAFSPKQEYCAPYHGLTVYSGTEEWPWSGKNCMYRYHVLDPVRFRKSIRVSFEHGNCNDLSNDYSSVAYWYQEEPHAPFPPFPSCDQRMPRVDA